MDNLLSSSFVFILVFKKILNLYDNPISKAIDDRRQRNTFMFLGFLCDRNLMLSGPYVSKREKGFGQPRKTLR